jgi:hypothetical protein
MNSEMPIPTSAPTLITRTRFQPPARPVFASMSAISFTSNSGSEVNHSGVRKVSVREFALRLSFDQSMGDQPLRVIVSWRVRIERMIPLR